MFLATSFVVVIAFGLSSATDKVEVPASSNIIGPDFLDKSYRIERHFVSPKVAAKLLTDLVFEAIPSESEEGDFPEGAVVKIGDAGDHDVKQHNVSDYRSALQEFTTDEFHVSNTDKHSLVYYLEMLDGSAFERSKNVVSTVKSSVLQNGDGTVHLYLSSPGSAALANHTDPSDIVALQLDGAKEWLLCTEEKDENPGLLSLRSPKADFSRKLDSCAKYGSSEIETLECKREILYPGDALFLPRRVVHSARALSSMYSAHLTFGYVQEPQECRGQYGKAADNRELSGFWCYCDRHCNGGCDNGWGSGCDNSCDSGCDAWCPGR